VSALGNHGFLSVDAASGIDFDTSGRDSIHINFVADIKRKRIWDEDSLFNQLGDLVIGQRFKFHTSSNG
jgi:hypothetical protein